MNFEVLIGVGIGAVIFALFLTFIYYAAYVLNSQIFGRTVWRGDENKNAVAITFDDGPSEDTEAILDVLKNYGVKATFFMIGRQVERFPHIARRIVREGHEIGNHSQTHPIYLFQTPNATRREIGQAQNVITEITGVKPRFARPPCGVRTPAYFSKVRELDLQTVQWNVAGFDWKPICAEKIAENVLRDALAGSIILLHDADDTLTNDRSETVKALPLIIEGIRSKNLKIISLAELIGETRAENWQLQETI